MTPRVLMWVQHLVGVGHQRRSAAVARALSRAGAHVWYVSGGMPVPDLDLGECELRQLPAARSLDMRYHTLVDERGVPVDDAWRDARRRLLLDWLDAFRPHAVVTETWPFGRGLLRFELEPLVERARAARPVPLLVCSMRDIVERRRQPHKYERMARRVEQHFDLVLVHSDPALLAFEDTFPLAERLRGHIRYTGYVSERTPVQRREPRPAGPILVSAGGGFFGERLLRTAIEAAPLCPIAPRPWLVLVGPNLPDARFQALRALAGAPVQVERNRADFHDLLRECAVSVSQGGYNTVVDLLASRTPAVLVPYADDRETEQLVRARHLAARGLVQVVEDAALDPRRLARAVAAAAVGEGMPRTTLNLDGARASARLVLEALHARSRRNGHGRGTRR